MFIIRNCDLVPYAQGKKVVLYSINHLNIEFGRGDWCLSAFSSDEEVLESASSRRLTGGSLRPHRSGRQRCNIDNNF